MEKTIKRMPLYLSAVVMVLLFFALMPVNVIKASALTATVNDETAFKAAVESESYKNGTVNITGDFRISTDITVKYPMTIDMKGHTITLNDNYCLKFDPNEGNTVTITGNGTFKGKNSGAIIKLYKGKISFLNGKVINDFATTDLNLGYAFLADSSNYLQNITITEGDFYSNVPIQASTSVGEGHVTIDKNSCYFSSGLTGTASAHMIVLPQTTNMGIMVAGNTVTAAISKDILGDGVFDYDPTNKTLYVRGDYTGTAKEVIRNVSVDKLTIRTTGNKLTNTLSGTIALYKDTIITGSNTDWALALNNGGYNAIAVWNGADLTLRNVTLKISNSRFGINGRDPAQKSSLSLNSAAAYISSTEGAVVNFGKKLNIIDNATIVTPSSSWMSLDAQTYGIYDKKTNAIAKNAVIAPADKIVTYGLKSDGVSVNNYNHDDVLNNGIFSYDNAQKILYVKGDHSTDKCLIDSSINGLLIRCENSPKLSGSIKLHKYAYLRGDLTLESYSDYAINLFEESSLTLNSAVLTINCEYAFYGDTRKESISLNDSDMYVNCDNYFTPVNHELKNINLDHCAITVPENYRKDGGKIYDSDGVIVKKLTVRRFVTEYVQAVSPTCTTAGNKAHYKCKNTGRLFRDEAATEPLSEEDVIVPATNHSAAVHHEEIPADCYNGGYKEYWYCDKCKKYFTDAEKTKEVKFADLIVEALGHDTEYDLSNISCTEETVAEGVCRRCGGKRTAYVPAQGHKFTENRIEPTAPNPV